MVRSRCGVGLLAIFAGFALFASPTLAEQATVTLNDGRTLTGELISEDAQKVVLQISGIQTPIDRKDVARVETRPSVEAEYRQRREALQDSDVTGRLALTQWLLEERALSLAQQEVRDLRRTAPDDRRVRTMVATVDAAVELDRQAGATPARQPRRPDRASQAEGAGQADQAEQPTLLDDKQITLIKIWELPTDLSTTAVRFELPRPVVEEIFDRFRTDPEVPRGRNEQRAFFARSPVEQLSWLFDMATRNADVREYYDDVIVRGDPEAIVDFRRALHGPYVQRYFRRTFVEQAQVPGLVLFANQPNTNAELYTNFYILTQLEVDGQPMINRTTPRESLLLQWGLPREAASYPAPESPGWRPFFSGLQDPNFNLYVDWIESLYRTAGDYGIDYTPPGGSLELSLKSEDQPTAPAAQPQRGTPQQPQPQQRRPSNPRSPQ